MPAASFPLDPPLRVDEIQGNILGGFNKDHQAVLPLSFDGAAASVAAVRAWLAEVAPGITWLAEVAEYRRERHRRLAAGVGTPEVPALWMNLSFSFPGLRKLTPDADAFEPVFRGGLPSAASRLGDPTGSAVPGDPSTWVVGGPGEIPDMLAILAGDDPAEVESAAAAFLARAAAAGIRCSHPDIGHDLSHYSRPDATFPRGHEHFGFKDGISQPGVRGILAGGPADFLTPRVVPDHDPAANTPQLSTTSQPLVCPGEFVLGYPRQHGALGRLAISPWPLAPEPSAIAPGWARDGSFLVYRRLAQDVPAFNRFLADMADQLSRTSGFAGLKAEKLGAMLVGRWRSGAPFLRSPDADNPDLAGSEQANNAFFYDSSTDPRDGFLAPIDDPFGEICPQAAHIRKVNPRNLGTDQGTPNATLTRRLLRRGIPFGPPLPFGSTEDPGGEERGLLFLSYQASIGRQFEFLAANWMNSEVNPNGNFSPEGGYDMVVGQAPGTPGRDRSCPIGGGGARITTQGRTPNQWVIPTGGGYFFTPSRSALRDVLIGPGSVGVA